MSQNIIYSDAGHFEQDVLASELPVVVDFYSEDCPPCEALAPVFERMALRMEGKARFVKILRQANRPLAAQLGVMSSPTLLFYRNGREVGHRLNGFMEREQIRAGLKNLTGVSLRQASPPRYDADVIILGSGPAGLAAAIYCSRARLKTAVIEQGLPGGQAATTFEMANYPGTSGTIRGRELTSAMLAQARSFGAEVFDLQEVYRVDVMGEMKVVETDEAEFHAPAIILATGAQPRRLPVAEEPMFRGHGVHYCATCDGAIYEDADVVVVGGGNSAVEEAHYLTRFARSVTIVHEFDHFQASKIAQENALANPKISVVWNSHAEHVLGEGRLEGLAVKNLISGEITQIPASGVFVYIGLTPRTELVKGQVDLNDYGYIAADESTVSSVPGVFAAGDVRSKTVRQVVTAASDGAVAAVQAEKFLTALSRKAKTA